MKRDNKGFTLLEVLIAVVILALIAVPLLRSFVSSYRVNARSRELMRATTLAQNEMEIFEKEKLEVLLDDEKYNYTVDDTETYTTHMTQNPITGDVFNKDMEHVAYTFTYDGGIINDETGREMFDVVVKMNPQINLTSYSDANTAELLFMNTLSGADSGAYVQQVRNSVNTDGEDEEIYKIYVNKQNPDSPTGSRLTVDDFARLLDRTINLKIEWDEESGLAIAKVEYQYGFAPNNGEMPNAPDEYTRSAGEKVIFNNAQSLDEEGNPVKLQSVYLFYAPRYEYANGGLRADGVVKEDKIVIENIPDQKTGHCLPVNVYIIRQNVLDSSGDILGIYTDDTGHLQNSVPHEYRANIKINDGIDEDGKTYGNYFTNLNLGSVGATEHGTTVVTMNALDKNSNVVWNYTGNDAIEIAGFKSLGSTEAKDRIYTLNVAVYTHGADVENDEPLVELTGTKIE